MQFSVLLSLRWMPDSSDMTCCCAMPAA